MIKFEGNPKKDSMLDADKWGEPELVKPVSGDNVLNAMSLDMTYFEANGKHYLIWADETKNSQNPDGLSYLFIASIDPENPTQLTSKAKLLTKPEFAWELVRYKVNEGPGVFKKDGKVYMKNPLMAMSYDTWVEGTLSEDGKTITIPMGQTLFHSEFYDVDVILSWGSTSEGIINWDTWEVEVNYTPDFSVEAAVFTIDGETITLQGSQGANPLTGEDLAEFAATGLSAIWPITTHGFRPSSGVPCSPRYLVPSLLYLPTLRS